MYKLNLVKLFYDIASDNMPPLISDLPTGRESQYNLRGHKRATVPRFSTHFMKNSIHFRGTILRDLVSDYLNDSNNFKQLIRKVKLERSFRKLNFTSLYVQLVPKKTCDFIFETPDFYVNPYLIS